MNMAKIFGMFIYCVFVMSFLSSLVFRGSLMPMLAIDALALAGAYYFYILWDKRPVRLACPDCKAIILSNTPWVCAYCKKTNSNANEYPFVHKCGYCGDEPKTYKCHHCGFLIFLSEDQDSINYAYCLNSPAEVPKADKRVEKLKAHQEKKQDKQERIDIALLDERLRNIRKRLNGEKKKSAKERLVAGYDSSIELEQARDELRVAIAEECKGDKKMLRRRYAALDKAFNDQLAAGE
jgi:hypothetical protein